MSEDNSTTRGDGDNKLVYRVARMTRMLRNSMRELELDSSVVKASELIPDAKERLGYVATMTEQAAERTLNSVEVIRPLQNEIKQQASDLRKSLSEQAGEGVSEGLERMASNASATQKQLMDIVMAQDYQDLTGQVLKRLMDVIHDLESELVAILMEHVDEKRAEQIKQDMTSEVQEKEFAQYLNGPDIHRGNAQSDADSGGDDVDDLLAELDL